jgi:hypothetical protein
MRLVKFSKLRCWASGAVASSLLMGSVSGAPIEFTLTGTNMLTAEPFVNVVGATMSPQDSAGTSLKTTFTGTLTVDVDDPLNPTTITFLGGNAVAANSGSWLPEVGGGSAGDEFVDGDATPGTAMPANFGFFLDLGGPQAAVLYAAVRDTTLSFQGSATPVTGGQFSPFGIGVTVPQGTYHANLSSGAFGDDAQEDDLSDRTGTNCTIEDQTVDRCTALASYQVVGNTATLTLPLDFILSEGANPEVRFTGTWVATYSVVEPVPGDFDQNGTVDGVDLLIWQRGGSPNPLDAGDFAAWEGNFGGTAAVVAAVPEPSAALLGLLAIALCGRKRD